MSSTTRRQEGRHALVTGAGTGIGRAIALRLAREGAALSLLARDAGRLEETRTRAAELGNSRVHIGSCDVRDAAQVDAAVDAAAEAGGPFDILIANSGIGGPNGPDDEGGDRFDDLVATNLSGSYYTFRALRRHLAAEPELRHMIFVSSILGRIGVAGYSGYCAAKAGLLGLTRSLAVELAPEGVQVNAICPGWVDTQMAHDGLEDMARAIGCSKDDALKIALSQVPAGRMSTPGEVAGLVAWLVSEDACGVTGQGLDINGGAFMS